MSIIDRIRAVFRRLRTDSPAQIVWYKEQKIYTMVNTLTLSTEMDILYLIDNGRAIAFPLSGNGVLIGTLKGQITVATAIDGAPVKEEVPSEPPVSSAGAASRGASGQSVKLPVTESSQWTFVFSKRAEKLFAIGATDIDISLRAGGGGASANCILAEFDLSNFVILLRRVKNALVIEELTRVATS